MKILTVKDKKEEKFLRTKVGVFDFARADAGKIRKTIAEMEKTMEEAGGIGLSANQVGIGWRMFIARLPGGEAERSGESGKLYAVFNPEIKPPFGGVLPVREAAMEEGCLSVPGVYGTVKRPEKIVLVGRDENGRKIKIRAGGLLARVFQHETDHLDGILFTDKAVSLKTAG